MTTQSTNRHSNNLPQEDHLQDDILPQEDQHQQRHFCLHTIQQATNLPFTEAHQDRYSANITINPFQLLEIHNQLTVLEGQLSQLTDTVTAIVVQLHNMTHYHLL
jgi:hypothetical protein